MNNKEDDNTVEITEKLIQENLEHIEWLTEFNNECRYLQRKYSRWWLALQTACVICILIAQLFGNLAFGVVIMCIFFMACVCGFMLKNTERQWDNLIIDGEKSILSAMERKKEWENFLKEYRGY